MPRKRKPSHVPGQLLLFSEDEFAQPPTEVKANKPSIVFISNASDSETSTVIKTRKKKKPKTVDVSASRIHELLGSILDHRKPKNRT